VRLHQFFCVAYARFELSSTCFSIPGSESRSTYCHTILPSLLLGVLLSVPPAFLCADCVRMWCGQMVPSLRVVITSTAAKGQRRAFFPLGFLLPSSTSSHSHRTHILLTSHKLAHISREPRTIPKQTLVHILDTDKKEVYIGSKRELFGTLSANEGINNAQDYHLLPDRLHKTQTNGP
jgi:hypothetical protein